MLSWGFIADAVLIVLLAATLLQVVRLSRRLAELRKDRAAFEGLIADFAKATADAHRGVAELRQSSEGIGRELTRHIERGQGVVGELQHSADDLKMLINRAESAAGRLEAAIGAARPLATAHTAPRGSESEPLSAVGNPAGSVGDDPQTRALLSALGRIR
jgi:septal ring factor EnvC (AmiA/AmiB activator)